MTLAQWSRETGIKRETISRRLELGWSIDRVLYHKVDTKKPNYQTVDGVTKRFSEWCRDCGVAKSTVRNRLNRGLTIKESLGL